jgi:hypothetical protein
LGANGNGFRCAQVDAIFGIELEVLTLDRNGLYGFHLGVPITAAGHGFLAAVHDGVNAGAGGV